MREHSLNLDRKEILFTIIFTILFCGVVRAQNEPADSIKLNREYSFWLVPEGEKFDFFQNWIEDLSRKHGGPIFIPHITLIGNIRMGEEAVLTKSKQLANLLHPFSVELNGVSYGDEYFRCIYGTVEKTDPIVRAHEQVLEVFESTAGEFMPHLSLLYGNHDKTQKEKIASELQIKESLTFTNLHVFETSKHLEPENWRLVGKIPFGEDNDQEGCPWDHFSVNAGGFFNALNSNIHLGVGGLESILTSRKHLAWRHQPRCLESVECIVSPAVDVITLYSAGTTSAGARPRLCCRILHSTTRCFPKERLWTATLI